MLENPEKYMQLALQNAEKALAAGEVPVGAVVVYKGELIAEAYNEVESRSNATGHAEVLVISRAGEKLGNWRLGEASLFVTLEPCPMCMGAILQARISELYFGAYDKQKGAAGSLFDLSDNPELSCGLQVYPGFMQSECEKVLSQFFDRIRG